MKNKILLALAAGFLSTMLAAPAEAADIKHSHHSNRPVKVVKMRHHGHYHRPQTIVRYYTPQRYVAPFYYYRTPVRYSYGYGHNHHDCRR